MKNKSQFRLKLLGACIASLALSSPAWAQQAWCQHDFTYPGFSSTFDTCFPGDYLTNPTRIYPAVVLIHGGGWSSGDKSDTRPIAERLAQEGYIAYSINHRYASTNPWPAQYEDVGTFMYLVRSTAPDMRVDINRVATLGISSGGHLALLMATYPEMRSFVRCAASLVAPTDLSKYDNPDVYMPSRAAAVRSMLSNLFNVTWTSGTWSPTRDLAILQNASPFNYLTPGLRAQFYLEYGAADSLVPSNQVTDFVAKAQSLGATATFRSQLGEHEGVSYPIFTNHVVDFFRTCL